MTLTSMSRSMVTELKKGWLSISGKVTPKASGRMTMFFTACSLGT